MKKTTVYLEEEVDAGLARVAAAEGISKAEVMRRALRHTANGNAGTPFSAIGVFRGPGDLADNVDRHLDGFGED